MNDDTRMKRSDLLYDYIKFHLGLYLATPPVLGIVAEVLGIECNPAFQFGLLGMIAIYFVSAAHASYFVASFVNVKWSDDKKWLEFGEYADKITRRFIHHYLYWIGLLIGLCGLVVAIFSSKTVC